MGWGSLGWVWVGCGAGLGCAVGVLGQVISRSILGLCFFCVFFGLGWGRAGWLGWSVGSGVRLIIMSILGLCFSSVFLNGLGFLLCVVVVM